MRSAMAPETIVADVAAKDKLKNLRFVGVWRRSGEGGCPRAVRGMHQTSVDDVEELLCGQAYVWRRRKMHQVCIGHIGCALLKAACVNAHDEEHASWVVVEEVVSRVHAYEGDIAPHRTCSDCPFSLHQSHGNSEDQHRLQYVGERLHRAAGRGGGLGAARHTTRAVLVWGRRGGWCRICVGEGIGWGVL